MTVIRSSVEPPISGADYIHWALDLMTSYDGDIGANMQVAHAKELASLAVDFQKRLTEIVSMDDQSKWFHEGWMQGAKSAGGFKDEEDQTDPPW